MSDQQYVLVPNDVHAASVAMLRFSGAEATADMLAEEAASQPFPTREQIADAAEEAMRRVHREGLNAEFGPGSVYEAIAEAVDALMQTGVTA